MEDSMINEDSTVHLTIRLIMQGKEVGSIIGKKGEIVKRFREESGAKINISDGTTPERIVTITGATNNIFKAFSLICQKFEDHQTDDQYPEMKDRPGIPRPPITLRLIVPASQCGSLIGKGGSKIKEIREISGASIQVASEMLPNSTERCVTISGTSDAITQCIYHICCVMLESPPKGATIPYRPKPQVAGPVILAGGQAYTIQGNYAVPAHDNMGLGKQLGAANPLAGLAALGIPGLSAAGTGGINTAALAALASSQLRGGNQGRSQAGTGGSPAGHNQQTHEMTVPNELIGCIIGKGGTKIAEIRQISGAMIRISKSDDRESTADRTISISGSPDSVILAQYLINMRQISGAMIRISNSEEREGGSTDRTITISGCADNVALAQYLINMSVELQKVNLEAQNSTGGNNQNAAGTGGGNAGSGNGGSSQGLAGSSPNSNSLSAAALPLAQLLAKPGALNALNSLQALGGLTDLLGLTGSLGGASQIQTTGVHRPHNRNSSYVSSRFRNNNADSGENDGRVTKTAKFQPY